MTFDNHRANAPPAELVREHQTGWAGPNYENVGHHFKLLDYSVLAEKSISVRNMSMLLD
jgi:hypothetical protein